MVHYRRNVVPGGTFFFTVTLAHRQSTLLTDYIDLLRAAFRQTNDERPFTIDAIAVLPEHLHVVLTLPETDADYTGRWRRLKGLFTRAVAASGTAVKKNERGEYDLWQKRYWEHTVRDESDFERCADYIHFNPVKHGLVASPADWPFSSLHRYVRAGILPADWGGSTREDGGDFGERAE